MSRIGKKPILIPKGVEIKIENHKVIIRGSKGELSIKVRSEIGVEVKQGKIFIIPQSPETKQTKAFWGLTRALLANIIEGVTKGFEKKLEIQGIGYKAKIEDRELVLNVGFSHPVNIKIPKELHVLVEKNIITVSGIDKILVGQISAVIRKVKPPESYKGKGIRYLGEQVRRKAGKKATTTT